MLYRWGHPSARNTQVIQQNPSKKSFFLRLYQYKVFLLIDYDVPHPDGLPGVAEAVEVKELFPFLEFPSPSVIKPSW